MFNVILVRLGLLKLLAVGQRSVSASTSKRKNVLRVQSDAAVLATVEQAAQRLGHGSALDPCLYFDTERKSEKTARRSSMEEALTCRKATRYKASAQHPFPFPAFELSR